MNTIKFALLTFAGLYVLIGVLIYFFQENLIFLPEELPRDFAYEFDYPFEELFLTMEDGSELNALHFKSDSSRGLILYFHGNAGSLERWGDVVEPFVKMGYDVIISDYRGYGKSTGDRTQKKMLSDAEALYQYALTKVDEEDLILYGRSVGSSFACHLAGKYNPEKLILEAPFYSLAQVAKKVIPIYPTSLLLKFNFKNHRSLKNASCPVYIFHGTDDEVVPYESGQQLFKSVNRKEAELITIERGGHNNLALFEGYWIGINRVLNE